MATSVVSQVEIPETTCDSQILDGIYAESLRYMCHERLNSYANFVENIPNWENSYLQCVGFAVVKPKLVEYRVTW